MRAALVMLVLAAAACSRTPQTAVDAGLVSVAPASPPIAPGFPDGRYISIEALRELDCVEKWEDLCSAYVVPQFVINGDKVIGKPWIDGTEVPYTVRSRTSTELEMEVRSLVAGENGVLKPASWVAPVRAWLTREGDQLFYDGPPAGGLARGFVSDGERIELVPLERVVRLEHELQKRFVPGGRCDDHYLAVKPRVKTHCINTPDGRPPVAK
jgi:hypothetical protein